MSGPLVSHSRRVLLVLTKQYCQRRLLMCVLPVLCDVVLFLWYVCWYFCCVSWLSLGKFYTAKVGFIPLPFFTQNFINKPKIIYEIFYFYDSIHKKQFRHRLITNMSNSQVDILNLLIFFNAFGVVGILAYHNLRTYIRDRFWFVVLWHYRQWVRRIDNHHVVSVLSQNWF